MEFRIYFIFDLQGGKSGYQIVAHLIRKIAGIADLCILHRDIDAVMIKIVAETQVVKETIESNLAQLKAGLQSHGLEVDEFDVTTSQDSHRDEQNPRHLPGYRLGSKASGRTAQNAPEGEAEKQVPTQTITDGSGKVDFFA